MSEKFRLSFTKILMVLLIFALVEFGWWLFLQWQKEKLNSYYLEIALAELSQSKEFLNIKYIRLNDKLKEVKASLQDAKDNIGNLVQQLENETKEKNILSQKFTEAKRQRVALEQKLEDLQKQLDRFSKKMANEKQKEAALQQREAISGIQAPPEVSKEGIPLEKIVITSPNEIKDMVQGSIIVVNKEYNFVVVDLGQEDGINFADNFLVYQDDRAIGSVKVEEVRPNMSVASFTSNKLRDLVKEGDRVVRQ